MEYEYYYEDDPNTVIQPSQIQASFRAAAVQAAAQHQQATLAPRPPPTLQPQAAIQERPVGHQAAVPATSAPVQFAVPQGAVPPSTQAATPGPAQFATPQTAFPARAQPALPVLAQPAQAQGVLPPRAQVVAPLPARSGAAPQTTIPVKGREPASAEQPKPEPVHILEQINE